MGLVAIAGFSRLAAALLIGSLISPPVGADFGPCVVPQRPTLPAQISDDAHGEQLLEQMMTYMQASLDYSKCVREFAASRSGLASADERAETESALSQQVAERQSFAQEWNSLYGAYQASALGIERANQEQEIQSSDVN